MKRTYNIQDEIKEQISSNDIILYMKGVPERPECGFSAKATQMLTSIGKPFAYINILVEPEIRANLHEVSDWPTFPQLFVNGELVGGCDIMTEMYDTGELSRLINE
jgi:monothiol glutaredoxin